MYKHFTSLKALAALALGSFALGADAALPTASDAPADGNFAENTTWYNWQKSGSGAYVVNLESYKTTSGNNFLLTNTSLPGSDDFEASQWCFVGDNENGYTIYNKAAGTTMVLGSEPNTANSGLNSIVKLYDAANAGDAVTKFYIGEHNTADCIYIELFTTKDADTHYMLNQRTLGGQNALSLWTTCGTAARASDAGCAYKFTETSNYLEVLNAAKDEAKATIRGVQEFYHDQTAFNNLLNDLENATSTADIDACVERVMVAIDNKVVHLTYASHANDATKNSYLGVEGVGDNRIAHLFPEMGARTKWQLKRVAGTNRFRLRNIASDTYVTGSDNGLTVNTPGAYWELEFLNNTAVEGGVSLKYYGNNRCLTVGTKTIGGQAYEYALAHSANAAGQYEQQANAWLVTPAGVERQSIPEEGGYYVIRSNRGLTGTPNNFAEGYFGSLLGVYTPDREKARNNKNYNTGVHLRQFMTGMQTIWKIVPQADGGYKVYSLMGEGENGEPLMGMTVSGSNSAVTITENPTTLYFINADDYTGYTADKKSPMPYGVAISTSASPSQANCFDQANYLSGAENNSSINADFFVVANDGYCPANESGKTNQGTVFYIERVSSYDVEKAKAAFIDYAQNNRMFELLKNVLTPEEVSVALAEKTTDASTISTIAAARAYLNEGEHAASTLAFEQLDGKVVRFLNRMDSGWYMSTSGNNLFAANTDADSSLDRLWEIEVVDAAMRQMRLKNYASQKYVGPITTSDNANVALADNVDNAGTYKLARYYSLDGESFFANLLADNNDMSKNALHRASQGGNKIVRWTHSALASQWTMLDAVAEDVAATEIELTYDKENKLIVVEGASLEKTADFPEAYSVKLIPSAAVAALADEAATPVEVVIPDEKIVKDGETFTVDLSDMDVTPADYTLNFPVGYFTVNSKLAPALSAAVKVEDTTGIKEIGVSEKAANVIYDLQGRRVSNASKGVYIINGVKTLVK